MSTHRKALRPGRTSVTAICLLAAAVVARTFTSPQVGSLAGWYVALFILFIALFMGVLWRPDLPGQVLHVYFALQSAFVLVLLSLNPEIDFITVLFVMLSYQAALVLTGRPRRIWIVTLVLLTPASLMVLLEPLRGLALGLSPMAFAIILPALVVVNEELEKTSAQSHALLCELQDKHRQLERYAGQAEELAAMRERERLARELHDSVSQTLFGIVLNTRTAQVLLEREPDRVCSQLENLQALTQNALTEMRGLISTLRATGD